MSEIPPHLKWEEIGMTNSSQKSTSSTASTDLLFTRRNTTRLNEDSASRSRNDSNSSVGPSNQSSHDQGGPKHSQPTTEKEVSKVDRSAEIAPLRTTIPPVYEIPPPVPDGQDDGELQRNGPLSCADYFTLIIALSLALIYIIMYVFVSNMVFNRKDDGDSSSSG